MGVGFLGWVGRLAWVITRPFGWGRVESPCDDNNKGPVEILVRDAFALVKCRS